MIFFLVPTRNRFSKYPKMKIHSGPVFTWMIIVMFIGSSCTINFNMGTGISSLEETVLSGEGDNKLLMLEISGVISQRTRRSVLGSPIQIGMVERVREILKKAEEDKEIKALWVRVNSPGGTVTASDMIYHEIQRYKKKTKQKVYVSFMDLSASGGYYISMAGDHIMAHPTSITGSIGVIALKPNVQGLLGKIGVEFEVVKSGEKKDFLSPWRPFTESERKLFQETIDDFHQRFVGVIAENRPHLDLASVRKLADGRVYTATQALELKMIDQVSYLDESVEYIKKDLGLSGFKVISYHRSNDHKTNLYSEVPGNPSVNLFNLQLDFLPEMEAPQFLYMWVP